MSQKATAEQVEVLQAWGIIVPPTRAACNSLLMYINEGNATVGKTVEERIAITKKYQAEWLGKRVKDTAGAIGRVDYLVARSSNEIFNRATILIGNTGSLFPHPFVAIVRWDGKRSLYKTSLYSIRPLD